MTTILCLSLTIAMVVAGSIVQAQQPKKVFRIGYLSAVNARNESPRSEAIRLALRELGHIEGQNIAIEYRYSEGKVDRAPELAAELVHLKIDIIVVAGGDPWIQAAKNATKTIPIVMLGPGSDPVEAGFIESLARPGGNVTGLTTLNRELVGSGWSCSRKPFLKLSASLFSTIRLVQGGLDVKEVLPVAALALGLTVQPWEVRSADNFERVFAALTKERPDGLYVLDGPLININGKRIADFALERRLPSVYGARASVDAGGLMSYRADPADSYRRVATYVDRILKGANPGDLPVEQPTKFELAINLKTAKQIGLTIPQKVLARADKIIK